MGRLFSCHAVVIALVSICALLDIVLDANVDAPVTLIPGSQVRMAGPGSGRWPAEEPRWVRGILVAANSDSIRVASHDRGDTLTIATEGVAIVQTFHGTQRGWSRAR
jgi:hypothetical protein